MAVAVVAVAADGHPAIHALTHTAHRGLQALAAKTAVFSTHPAALVGTGHRHKVQLATQHGGAGRRGVGAAPRADQGRVARLDQTDDEGAIGLVERQAVLQQQHAPVHRVALDARATNAQARLVGATKKVLQHDARLVVQRIAQRGQARFFLRLGQVGATGHFVQFFAFGLHGAAQRHRGAGAGGLHGDGWQRRALLRQSGRAERGDHHSAGSSPQGETVGLMIHTKLIGSHSHLQYHP